MQRGGTSLGTVKYEFRYPTPFKSVWAWIVYVAVAFALTYFFIRWRTAKVVAHNKKVAERELMQQKMKVLEQERIIAEQQKVILENELSVKGKDVASMALDMVAMKNSMESVREQLLEGMRHGTITSKTLTAFSSNSRRATANFSGARTTITSTLFTSASSATCMSNIRNSRRTT